MLRTIATRTVSARLARTGGSRASVVARSALPSASRYVAPSAARSVSGTGAAESDASSIFALVRTELEQTQAVSKKVQRQLTDVARAAVNGKNFQALEEICMFALEHKLLFDTNLYVWLLNSNYYLKQYQKVVDFFAKVSAAGAPIPLGEVSHVFYSLMKLNQADKIPWALDTLKKPEDTKTLGNLLCRVGLCLAQARRHGDLAQILARPEFAPSRKFDTSIYEYLYSLAPNGPKQEEYLDFITDHFTASTQPGDQRYFAALMRAYMRLGDKDSVEDIAEEIVSFNDSEPIKDIKTLTILLRLAMNRNDEQTSRKVIDITQQNKVARDANFYALQTVFEASRGHWEETFRLLGQVADQGMKFTRVLYLGLVKQIDVPNKELQTRSLMQRLVTLIQKREQKMDTQSASAFLTFYLSRGLVPQAISFLDAAPVHGGPSQLFLGWAQVLETCAKLKMAPEFNGVLAKLKSTAVPADLPANWAEATISECRSAGMQAELGAFESFARSVPSGNAASSAPKTA